jgi:hypothetical protein
VPGSVACAILNWLRKKLKKAKMSVKARKTLLFMFCPSINKKATPPRATLTKIALGSPAVCIPDP